MSLEVGHDFDQISLSSSCELVDSLAEAVLDQQLVSSALPEIIFTGMLDKYTIDRDMVVQFQFKDMGITGFGDRVGMYKLPKTQAHEYVAYVWVKGGVEGGEVTFDMSVLVREEGEFQLMYLQADNIVIGTSDTVQILKITPLAMHHPCVEKQTLSSTRNTNDAVKTCLDGGTDTRCQSEMALAEKVRQFEVFSLTLSICEKVCKELCEENKSIIRERDEMASMLENVMEERAKAVGELRAVIMQQDKLMQEVSLSREKAGNAGTALVIDKQDFADAKEIKHLLSSLGIQENISKDASSLVDKLSNENKDFTEQIGELKGKIQQLEIVNKTLENEVWQLRKKQMVTHVEGEEKLNLDQNENRKVSNTVPVDQHMKRLNHHVVLEGRHEPTLDHQLSKLVSSGQENCHLNDQMLCQAVYCSSGVSTLEPEGEDLSTVGLNSLNSKLTLLSPETITINPLNAVHHHPPSAPQLPPDVSPPSSDMTPIPNSLECPLCKLTFLTSNVKQLQDHVNLHMDNILECPFCNLIFEEKDQLEFEEHVEDHCKEQF